MLSDLCQMLFTNFGSLVSINMQGIYKGRLKEIIHGSAWIERHKKIKYLTFELSPPVL